MGVEVDTDTDTGTDADADAAVGAEEEADDCFSAFSFSSFALFAFFSASKRACLTRTPKYVCGTIINHSVIRHSFDHSSDRSIEIEIK